MTDGWHYANIVLSLFFMDVMGIYLLEDFVSTHNQSHKALYSWLKAARANAWHSLLDIRKVYSSADGGVKGKYTVFNIAGNKLRLITTVNYVKQTIVIENIFTHAQYDRWNRK